MESVSHGDVADAGLDPISITRTGEGENAKRNATSQRDLACHFSALLALAHDVHTHTEALSNDAPLACKREEAS